MFYSQRPTLRTLSFGLIAIFRQESFQTVFIALNNCLLLTEKTHINDAINARRSDEWMRMIKKYKDERTHLLRHGQSSKYI